MNPKLHLAAALSAQEVHRLRATLGSLEGRAFFELCIKTAPLQVQNFFSFSIHTNSSP